MELGQVDMVQVLIGDPRVDPTDQNMRCIISAAVEGHADILRILFKDKRLNNPPNLLQAQRASIPFGKIQIIELVLSYSKLSSKYSRPWTTGVSWPAFGF